MALFNKLNDLAKSFGEKTTDLIETGKLSSRANAERNAAGEELKKIGQFYYDCFINGDPVAPEVEEFCRNAQVHLAAADEAQQEIDRLQAEKEAARAAAQPPVRSAGATCPDCGAPNAEGTKFCQNCGARLEAPGPKFCPDCGAEAPENTRFCPQCGYKLL